MSPFERWTHHLSNLLVGGTGLVYAAMRYLLEPTDPFAVVNHPWQPQVQHLHILFAPLLVFAIGFSWRSHIAPRWKKKRMPRFKTGIVMFFTFVPMIVSGSLIQTAVSATWRDVWVGVHLAASALWMLGYLGHQLGAKKNPQINAQKTSISKAKTVPFPGREPAEGNGERLEERNIARARVEASR